MRDEGIVNETSRLTRVTTIATKKLQAFRINSEIVLNCWHAIGISEVHYKMLRQPIHDFQPHYLPIYCTIIFNLINQLSKIKFLTKKWLMNLCVCDFCVQISCYNPLRANIRSVCFPLLWRTPVQSSFQDVNLQRQISHFSVQYAHSQHWRCWLLYGNRVGKFWKHIVFCVYFI